MVKYNSISKIQSGDLVLNKTLIYMKTKILGILIIILFVNSMSTVIDSSSYFNVGKIIAPRGYENIELIGISKRFNDIELLPKKIKIPIYKE
jgi:hypothetical protein